MSGGDDKHDAAGKKKSIAKRVLKFWQKGRVHPDETSVEPRTNLDAQVSRDAVHGIDAAIREFSQRRQLSSEAQRELVQLVGQAFESVGKALRAGVSGGTAPVRVVAENVPAAPRGGEQNTVQEAIDEVSSTAPRSAKDPQVFISLHVGSSAEFAKDLRDFLEERGLRVWLCTDMDVGVGFRNEIVSAVDSCKIFLALINNKWAESAECEDEFNYARRRNLTSHAEGRTKPGQPRLPIIMPLAFSDLDWKRYPHVRLLSTSTNFLPVTEERDQNGKALMHRVTKSMSNMRIPAFHLEELAQDRLLSKPIDRWSVQDVQQLAREHNYPSKAIEKIGENALDGADLKSITQKELQTTLGITSAKAAKLFSFVKRALSRSSEKDASKRSDEEELFTVSETLCEDTSAKGLGKTGGTFVLEGYTKNNYDGNLTKGNNVLFTFQNGRISGTVDYAAGTLYNVAEVATVNGHYGPSMPAVDRSKWTNFDPSVHNAAWAESYHGGRSEFYYSGKIDADKVHGVYKMGGRNAFGTFEFRLIRWL